MQLGKFLVLAAAGLVTATTWTFPPDAADGLYKLVTDESGNSTLTLLSSVEARSVPRGKTATRNIEKRLLQGPIDWGCKEVINNHGEADAVYNALHSVCDGAGLAPHSVYFSKTGGTVGYVCNYSDIWNHCYLDELEQTIPGGITNTCGRYVGGFAMVYDRAVEYGYKPTAGSFCQGKYSV